jgi:hypothetical protein
MSNAHQNTAEPVTAAQPSIDELPTRLYPRRYARQQRGKALGHLVPALVLVTGALSLLAGREKLTPLLGLEFVVGAAYLVLMVRELRHLRHGHPHHEEVAWLELASAGILGLEGYHIWHRHHEATLAGAPPRMHVLPWLYAGLAVVYVGLAFGLARLGARRYLHLHAHGFSVRTRLLGRAQEAHWSQLTSVEHTGSNTALLHFADGRQQPLAFDHLHEGAAHCSRFVAHAQHHLSQPG